MLENCIYFLFYRRLRKIFKKISMASKLSDNLFRRTVRTMTAILKSRSTGALVGIDVLYFMNKAFIWGYLFSILMKVSLSRREKSTSSKSSSFSDRLSSYCRKSSVNDCRSRSSTGVKAIQIPAASVLFWYFWLLPHSSTLHLRRDVRVAAAIK